MIKYVFCFAILSVVAMECVYAQHPVSGFVYDRESGEPLIGASVSINNHSHGTVSDNSGRFYLSVPKSDTLVIQVSYLGYRPYQKTSKFPTGSQPLIIRMDKTAYSIGEVTVTNQSSTSSAPGNMALSADQIRVLPALLGEPDILKAFHLLPGVQQGTEGSTALIVRGGSGDQNLYLLDGIPLYYANHLGGLVSTFDVSSVKKADLYKGFFPANYGDRLSSVLDVQLKDGDLYQTRKEFSLGTLSTRFFCEGPLKNEKTSYLFSTRFCNIGCVVPLFDDIFYTFYDVNLKLTHRIDANNKIYASLYSGADYIRMWHKDDDEFSSYDNYYHFGDNMANVRWFHVLNPFCSANTILSYSAFGNTIGGTARYKRFDTEYEDISIKSKVKYRSSVSDIQIQSHVDFQKYAGHHLKGGISVSLQHFIPQQFKISEQSRVSRLDTTIQNKTSGLRTAVYISDDWKIHQHLHLSAGLRLSSFSPAFQKNYLSLEPRIAVKFPYYRGVFHIGYSRMSQSLHSLSNGDTGIPKELWTPSTRTIGPAISDQFEVEISRKIHKDYTLTLSAYYKKLSHLIDILGGISPLGYWEDNVAANGKGVSKGIEFLFAKEQGRFNGYLSYVLSKSTRQFTDINEGKAYPFRYDYPHQINIVGNYQFNDMLRLVAAWTYHTGYATDMAFEQYLLFDDRYSGSDARNQVHIYTDKNGFRMPDYHRLDIGFTVSKQQSDWYLGLYNAYNRMNPHYYYLHWPKDSDRYVMKQKIMFPLLPSISYTYRF